MTACVLCHSAHDDSLILGEKLSKRGTWCHHFCLLFSPYLPQRGKDDEGIQGFVLTDIKNEIRRCCHKKCHYCGLKGAGSVCQSMSCSKVFHVSCAIKHDALLSFIGRFSLHCDEHRPVQKWSPRDCQEMCSICMEPNSLDRYATICTPCCGHLFHKNCLQRMALSSGYFFTCPTCRDKNNKNGFLRHLKRFGVFIPQRDASWECTPGAFVDLLDRPIGCNHRFCLCENGREYVEGKGRKWRLQLCDSCGSFGTHLLCSGLTGGAGLVWHCPDCRPAYADRFSDRKATLRQILEASDPGEQPRLFADIMGSVSWRTIMQTLDDPRQLLRFTVTAAGAVKVGTRCLSDPHWPGHVVPSASLPLDRADLLPSVVVLRMKMLVPRIRLSPCSSRQVAALSAAAADGRAPSTSVSATDAAAKRTTRSRAIKRKSSGRDTRKATREAIERFCANFGMHRASSISPLKTSDDGCRSLAGAASVLQSLLEQGADNPSRSCEVERSAESSKPVGNTSEAATEDGSGGNTALTVSQTNAALFRFSTGKILSRWSSVGSARLEGSVDSQPDSRYAAPATTSVSANDVVGSGGAKTSLRCTAHDLARDGDESMADISTQTELKRCGVAAGGRAVAVVRPMAASESTAPSEVELRPRHARSQPATPKYTAPSKVELSPRDARSRDATPRSTAASEVEPHPSDARSRYATPKSETQTSDAVCPREPELVILCESLIPSQALLSPGKSDEHGKRKTTIESDPPRRGKRIRESTPHPSALPLRSPLKSLANQEPVRSRKRRASCSIGGHRKRRRPAVRRVSSDLGLKQVTLEQMWRKSPTSAGNQRQQ